MNQTTAEPTQDDSVSSSEAQETQPVSGEADSPMAVEDTAPPVKDAAAEEESVGETVSATAADEASDESSDETVSATDADDDSDAADDESEAASASAADKPAAPATNLKRGDLVEGNPQHFTHRGARGCGRIG